MKGAFFVVGTPIGNLGDLTERGKNILLDADVIICESRERALHLINKLKEKAGGGKKAGEGTKKEPKRFLKLPAPEERKKAEKLADLVKELVSDGKIVVFITSAGMPAVSDPGAELVKECRKRRVPVFPVPGPSAPTTAISVSGITPTRFIFIGFPPKKGKKNFWLEVKDAVEKLPFKTSVVFFESPRRIKDTLSVIKEVFGEKTEIFLAREMTKIHEEYLHGNISEIIDEINSKEAEGALKGEITVVFAPPPLK